MPGRNLRANIVIVKMSKAVVSEKRAPNFDSDIKKIWLTISENIKASAKYSAI